MNSPRERLESALQAPEPHVAALALARTLRDEGMSQLELYRLYDECRALHEDDVDETLLDAVLDTMDYIVGWCSTGLALYDTNLLHNPT